MHYKRIFTAFVIAISLAMMSTAFASSSTIPFQLQQAYAIHPPGVCPPGFTPVHINGAPAGCFDPDRLQQSCDTGAPFDECGGSQECPPGEVGTPPNCEPVPPEECPPGEVGTPPNCEQIDCPEGQKLVDSVCVPIECDEDEILKGDDCAPLEDEFKNQGQCIKNTKDGESELTKEGCKTAFKEDQEIEEVEEVDVAELEEVDEAELEADVEEADKEDKKDEIEKEAAKIEELNEEEE